MTKAEVKLMKLLLKQEMACGLILNTNLLAILEFDDCVIRWN